MKANQETQDKIDLWTKNYTRALRKIGQMYNKIV